MSDYSAAIQHNPQHCRAYYNRAYANDRLKRFDLAVRRFLLADCCLLSAAAVW